MAKSIRSKVKKRNRTEMRKTVGDPHQRKLQARCTAKIRKSVAFSSGEFDWHVSSPVINPDPIMFSFPSLAGWSSGDGVQHPPPRGEHGAISTSIVSKSSSPAPAMHCQEIMSIEKLHEKF